MNKQSKNWNNIPCTIYNKETQNYISTGKKHDIMIRVTQQEDGILQIGENCEHCKMSYYRQVNTKEN